MNDARHNQMVSMRRGRTRSEVIHNLPALARAESTICLNVDTLADESHGSVSKAEGKGAMRVMIVVQRQSMILQVVSAGRTACGFASLLNRRHDCWESGSSDDNVTRTELPNSSRYSAGISIVRRDETHNRRRLFGH